MLEFKWIHANKRGADIYIQCIQMCKKSTETFFVTIEPFITQSLLSKY